MNGLGNGLLLAYWHRIFKGRCLLVLLLPGWTQKNCFLETFLSIGKGRGGFWGSPRPSKTEAFSKPSQAHCAQRLWVKSDGFGPIFVSAETVWRCQRREKRPETRAFRVGSVGGDLANQCVEARAGIEPAYTDLQSAASPLRHRASRAVRRGLCVEKGCPVNQ